MPIVNEWRRWMYRGGRPNRLARVLNRISAAQFRAGFLVPPTWATLEVPGRRTGNVISFPLVVTRHEDRRYVVSMLGANANWVANVRAADGHAILRHGQPERVHLTEVTADERPPILRHFLEQAPGARPHFPIDRHAPLADFEAIAADYPVFQVTRLDGPVP